MSRLSNKKRSKASVRRQKISHLKELKEDIKFRERHDITQDRFDFDKETREPIKRPHARRVKTVPCRKSTKKPKKGTGQRLYDKSCYPNRVICSKKGFFSVEPSIRRRNEKILFIFVAFMCGGLYFAFGVFNRRECPIQPFLPFWVITTAGSFLLTIPVVIFFFRETLNTFCNQTLKDKLHEKKDKSCWSRLTSTLKEYYLPQQVQVIFGASMALFVLTWWLFGCYLTYSVFRRVSFDRKVDRLRNPNYCDAIIFIPTMQMVTIGWIILGLSVIFILSKMVFDEKFQFKMKENFRVHDVMKESRDSHYSKEESGT